MLTPSQLDRAKSMKWNHSYDFGAVQTAERSGSLRPNQTLYGVFDMLNGIDVAGMKVLEVGPAHGCGNWKWDEPQNHRKRRHQL